MSEEVNQESEVLPSEAQEQSENPTPFNSEYLSENLRDGKLFGKFESVDDLAQNYRELEVAHTNKMREYKEAERGAEEQATQSAQQVELLEQRQGLIQSMIPEFMSNNMSVTESMKTTLRDEGGFTDEQIELHGLRLKDSINNIHSYADGRENYEAAIDWYRQRDVSDSEKQAFDKALTDPNFSKITVKGLLAEFHANNASPQEAGRTYGSNNNATVATGYTDRGAMFADRNAAMASPQGSKLRASFDAKMAKTDQRIIYGR